jgi:predicted small lipoprotein YifL
MLRRSIWSASMPLNLSTRRAPLFLAACLALGLGACGRRGPLEPPVDPSAAAQPPGAAAPASAAAPKRRAAPADPRLRPGAARAAQSSAAALATDPLSRVEDSAETEDSDDDVTDTVTPIPTARKRGRAFVVPTDPFVLDALL